MQRQILVWLLLLLVLLTSILLVELVVRHTWRKGGPSLRVIVRRAIGWGCIVVGLFALILPGPGIPLLIIGVMLVGWRHSLLRRAIVVLKLRLRRWAQQPGVRGWIGRRGKRLAYVLSSGVQRAHVRVKA